jgi:glutathione S-transferase
MSYDEHKAARLELAEARTEIERLRAQVKMTGHLAYENRVQTERAEAAVAELAEARAENDRIWAEVEKHLAEIERLHRDALAEADAYRTMFARAEAAEAERDELRATVKRVEAAILRADPPGGMRAGTPTVSVAVLRAALAVPAPPVTQTSEDGA